MNYSSEDMLSAILESLKLEASAEDYKKILTGIKKSFDNQDECLRAVYMRLEDYLDEQNQKREQIVTSAQEKMQKTLLVASDDAQNLQAALAKFKERNYQLTQACDHMNQELVALIKLRNTLIGSVFILGLSLLMLVPLVIKNNQESYQEYAGCNSSPGILSTRLCK
jgi:hypothetical protein